MIPPPPPPAALRPARTARLLHGAMITGLLLFAVVAHFVLRRDFVGDELPPVMLRVLLGASLAACVVAFVLRRRVPRRSTDESADLFWTTATQPALLTWASLEGASLIAIFTYGRTSAPAAAVVATIAVVLFIAMNPAYLERA